MNKLIVLALLSAFSFAACKSSQQAVAAKALSTTELSQGDYLTRKTADAYAASIAIRIERTSCYGTCPVYTAVIFANGQGLFEGRHHTEQEGKFTFSVTPEAIAMLQAQAAEINYWKLEDAYKKPVSDFPTTYSYFNNGKQRKQIENYRGAPAVLSTLEKAIDEVVFAAEFTAL